MNYDFIEKTPVLCHERSTLSDILRGKHVMDSIDEIIYYAGHFNTFALRHIPEKYSDNEELWAKLITLKPSCIRFAPATIRDNKSLAISSVLREEKLFSRAAGGYNLQYVSEGLADDDDVVEQSVKRCIWSVEHASERFRRDKDYAKKILEIDPELLRVFCHEVRDDDEIVNYCVSKDKYCLNYASYRIKNKYKKELAKVELNPQRGENE